MAGLKQAIERAFKEGDDQALDTAIATFNQHQKLQGRMTIDKIEHSPQGVYIVLDLGEQIDHSDVEFVE